MSNMGVFVHWCTLSRVVAGQKQGLFLDYCVKKYRIRLNRTIQMFLFFKDENYLFLSGSWFYRVAKFYMSVEVGLSRTIGVDKSKHSFSTPATELLESTDIKEEISRQIDILGVQIDNFVRNGKFINLYFWSISFQEIFIEQNKYFSNLQYLFHV